MIPWKVTSSRSPDNPSNNGRGKLRGCNSIHPQFPLAAPGHHLPDQILQGEFKGTISTARTHLPGQTFLKAATWAAAMWSSKPKPPSVVSAGPGQPTFGYRDARKVTREYLTKTGRQKIEADLQKLLTEDRRRIIRAIAEARSHGDLKENAEYHSAKDRQAMIEAQISYLKSILARAEVVDVASQSGPVKFGATVRLEDDDTGEEVTYQLVGEAESDLRNGKLNWKTAFAAALIGKDIGDPVQVRAPAGERFFTVLDIRYIA